MKQLPKIVTTILLIFALGMAIASPAMGATKIGVLAKRGAEKAMAQWGPTANYLTKKLGSKVTIIPLTFEEIEPAIKAKEIDFLLANSSFYALMKEKHGLKAMLTLMNERMGYPLHEFGGVLISRKGSGIKTIAQMKGKRFMCVKYSSFGGGQMAWRLLLKNKINPKRNLANFTEGKTHDNVVMAVKNGSTDVGTVRTDTLEQMQAEGIIKLSDFNIINQINDSFPFVHSTILYPEWPLAVLPHINKDRAKKLAKALKLMPQNAPAMKAAGITAWTYAANYTPVTECLTDIGYGSLKKNIK